MQAKPHRPVVLVLLWMLSATAQAMDTQPLAPVYAAAQTLIKQKLDQNLHNPRIELTRPGKRLRLPRCRTSIEYRLLREGPVSAGRYTIIARCGDPAWKLFISARVSGQLPAVVSATLIPRHTLIRPEQLRRQLFDSTRLPRGVLTRIEDAVGKRARRAIAPGTLIKAQMLLPPWWVHKGRPVTLISRIGAIEVQAKGIALKNAVENEIVAVKNARSGKTVRGIVIAPDTVLVP